MKALGLVVLDKIFKRHFEILFSPHNLLMQPIETVFTTSVGDHPGIIPVTIGQNTADGRRSTDDARGRTTDIGRSQ